VHLDAGQKAHPVGPFQFLDTTTPTITPTTTSSTSVSSTTAEQTATSVITHHCGFVAFTATASSQGAFNITATGTDCQTARSVAGAAKGHDGAPYTFRTFDCPRGKQSPPSGITVWSYRCVGGKARVTFDEQG
jgi:hypothetical protein